MNRNAVVFLVGCLYVAGSAWLISGEGENYRESLRRQRRPSPRADTSPPPALERQSSPVANSIHTPPAPARTDAPSEKSPAPPPTVPPIAMARADSATAPLRAAPPETKVTPAPTPTPTPTPAPTAERVPGAPAVPAMTLARDAIWDQPEVKRAWDLTHVSTQDEARLGAELYDLILQLNQRSEAGPWQQRVEEAAKPFLKALGRKDVRYTFTVLESDAVCAFSHPGGYVYVCRGLFDLIGEDEDYALEFAVGHEMAHVDLQHALRYLRDPGLMKLSGGTLQKLYMILIPFAYPDEAEFDADRWTYSRMRLAGRSDHRALAFLRKLKGYAEHNGFNNGRVKPKPKDAESSLLENHYRAHTATWKRLDQLKDFIAAAANPKK